MLEFFSQASAQGLLLKKKNVSILLYNLQVYVLNMLINTLIFIKYCSLKTKNITLGSRQFVVLIFMDIPMWITNISFLKFKKSSAKWPEKIFSEYVVCGRILKLFNLVILVLTLLLSWFCVLDSFWFCNSSNSLMFC